MRTAKEILNAHASIYFKREITDPTDDFILSIKSILPAMEEYAQEVVNNIKVSNLVRSDVKCSTCGEVCDYCKTIDDIQKNENQ